MKRKVIALAQLDLNKEYLKVTFIQKDLTKTSFQIPAIDHSFICMYNDILYLAKVNDYKIEYDEDFGGRFYNIYWTFPERDKYNERYIITENMLKVR